MPDPLLRELEDADLPALARLMADGFPRHSLEFWRDRLRRIAEREHPPGTPKLGYGIDADGLQGAALTLGSLHGPADRRQTLVNISSWTVRPSHRGAAAKALYRHATRAEGITFSNLSAAAHTLRTITACGFREGTAGQVLAIGTRRTGARSPRMVATSDAGSAGLAPERAETLRYHEARGCLAFCVELADRLAPLIFLPRRLLFGIPVAQLIYCERSGDLLDHSRAVQRELLRRGFPALLVDASGPVEGLVGRYFPGKAAKYYKGPALPYAVDHTHSEMIYIGF